MAQKLSQQIQASNLRETRTQRVFKQQQEEKARRYEDLRLQAQEIQRTRFANVTTIEEYEQEYNNLSPELKAFFTSPSELRSEQQGNINLEVSKADEKINYFQNKITEKRSDIERERAYYNSLTGSQKDRYRERYKKNINEWEDDIEEYETYLSYWRDGRKEVEGGYSFESVNSSVNDRAEYSLGKRDTRRRERVELKKIEEKVDTAIKTASSFEVVEESFKGKSEKRNIFAVTPSGEMVLVGEQKPIKEYEGSKPSTLGRTKVKQTISLGGRNLVVESDENLYVDKAGNLLTPYGSLGITEDQVRKEQKEEYEKQLKENDKKADEYLKDSGFTDSVTSKPQSKKRSFWGKVGNILKVAYVASPFGTSTAVSEEYNVRRETGKSKFFNVLTFGEASRAIKEEKERKANVKKQTELINQLDREVSNAPEEIRYNVQKQGLKSLSKAGITAYPTSKGELEFLSKDFKQPRSFNVYKTEKIDQLEERARKGEKIKGITVYTTTTPQRSTIIDERSNLKYPSEVEGKKTSVINTRRQLLNINIVSTKATEAYFIGKGVGYALGGVAKVGRGVYSSIGGGLRYSNAVVRGGKVTATIQKTSVLSEKARKGLRYVTSGLFYGATAGVYVASKASQKRFYEQTYGDVGKRVFELETKGELIGIGTLIGEESFYKFKSKKANRKILAENMLREGENQHARNVKRIGQNLATRTEVKYTQTGRGKISKEGVREMSFYDQTLTVKSPRLKSYPAGLFKDLKRSRKGLSYVIRSPRGNKELTIEFGKRGFNKNNYVLKVTSTKGRYGITNIFEKVKSNKAESLILKRTVVSKVVKARTAKIGGRRVYSFDIENRLLKFKPYGRERFAPRDAVKIGAANYNKGELAKMFIKAGESNRLSSKPFKSVKIEQSTFQKVEGLEGISVKDNSRYLFKQKGIGNKQVPLKTRKFFSDEYLEVLRQLNKNQAKPRRVSKLSEMIASPSNGKMVNAFKSTRQRTIRKIPINVLAQKADISPTITEGVKTSVKTKLKELPVSSTYTSSSSALAVEAALKTRQRNASLTKNMQVVKERLIARERVAEATKLIQRQTQGQKQVQRQKQITLSKLTLEPLMNPKAPSLPSFSITSSPKVPRLKIGILDRLEGKRQLKGKIKSRRKVQELAYLPDFTARSLDLEGIKIKDVGDADKLLKKIQTGFEIRRGIKIR